MRVSVCTLSARRWDISELALRLKMQSFTDFEWVIVDFLYDHNIELFQEIAKKNGIRIHHIPNARSDARYMRDIARNRNEAIMNSAGDIIIFLDDYTVVDSDFISEHVAVVSTTEKISCGRMFYMNDGYNAETSADGVLFKIDAILAQSVGNWKPDSRFDLLYGNVGPGQVQILPVLGAEWTYTGNLGISRNTLELLNGFDPCLSARGEDGDLGLRAKNMGIESVFNPFARSINLSTSGKPYCLSFDHDHHIDLFLGHAPVIINEPERVNSLGYDVIKKYGTSVVVCRKCGAEFMLDPSEYIYRKIRQKELVVNKALSDITKRKERK